MVLLYCNLKYYYMVDAHSIQRHIGQFIQQQSNFLFLDQEIQNNLWSIAAINV